MASYFLASAPHVPAAARARAALLFCACTVLCAAAIAQPTLDPIVVTATREPQPLDRIAADLVVIDARRIQDSTADSLEDLLRREAGVQLSRTGGPGQAAGVLLRGSAASNTLVLIDGVRYGSATLGQAALEAIDLSQVERVEVLRGPGSSLYGADAVGGVVQIITKRGVGAPMLSAQFAAGEYGSQKGNVALRGAQAGFDYAASFSRERSDGVSALRPGDAFGNYNPDRDGYARNQAQLRLGYAPAEGHRIGFNLVEGRLDAQYDASEFEPPDFLQDASPDFRNRLDTQVLSIDYRGRLAPAWTTTVQIARNEDDLRSGGSTTDRFDTRRHQASWQNAWDFATDQQLVLAYERLNEAAEAGAYAGEKKRHNNALVLAYAGSFGAASLQADWRHDDNSVYGQVNTGRLGASVALPYHLRLRALAGTTFRAPSFNELYFQGFGVESLEPERGRSLELGLDWRRGDSEVAATVYRNRVRRLIAYEPDRSFCPADPSYDFGCARNVNRARLQGATITAAQRWGGLSLRGTLDFLDATDRTTGARLARRAANQQSVAADYAQGPWEIGAALLRVGARPDGGAQLGSYATLDLLAAWRFAPRWELEAKLLNATDRDVEPVRDYKSPGRQAWLGVRLDGLGF